MVQGVHHVALICASLEASLAFYQGLLGLEINPERPHDKLPYRGAWLWIGAQRREPAMQLKFLTSQKLFSTCSRPKDTFCAGQLVTSPTQTLVSRSCSLSPHSALLTAGPGLSM